MTDIKNLYHDEILSYARIARKTGRLAAPTMTLSKTNPTCGDCVTIDLKISDEGRIAGVGCHVAGCSICEAATGLAMQSVIGMTAFEASQLPQKWRDWLQGDDVKTPVIDAESFAALRDFTARHHCLLLPFEVIAAIYPPKV